jgi:TATA-binding protein-associated factor
MASLSKYNLNFGLCDDMGLGKTLQSLCVVLNESFLEKQRTNKNQTNLIVSPTSITHNWHMEVKKFFP